MVVGLVEAPEAYAQLWYTNIYELNKGEEGKFETEGIKVEDVKTILEELRKTLEERLVDIEKKIREKNINIQFKSKKVQLENTDIKRLLTVPNLVCNIGSYEVCFSVKINPCIGRMSPSTKIVSVPKYKGALSEEYIIKFFTQAKDISCCVCGIIGDEYFNVLEIISKKHQIPFSNAKRDVFNLCTYVIGGNLIEFGDYIKSANDAEKMAEIVKHSNPLKKSIKILNKMRMDANDEHYSWFKHQRDGREGSYGFYSEENKGNIIGLTEGSPDEITTDLMLSLYSVA